MNVNIPPHPPTPSYVVPGPGTTLCIHIYIQYIWGIVIPPSLHNKLLDFICFFRRNLRSKDNAVMEITNGYQLLKCSKCSKCSSDTPGIVDSHQRWCSLHIYADAWALAQRWQLDLSWGLAKSEQQLNLPSNYLILAPLHVHNIAFWGVWSSQRDWYGFFYTGNDNSQMWYGYIIPRHRLAFRPCTKEKRPQAMLPPPPWAPSPEDDPKSGKKSTSNL